jgi:hypothetical protein
MTDGPRFVSVDVEEGPASEHGVSLRFKVAGAERVVQTLTYESEEGAGSSFAIGAIGAIGATCATCGPCTPPHDANEDEKAPAHAQRQPLSARRAVVASRCTGRA